MKSKINFFRIRELFRIFKLKLKFLFSNNNVYVVIDYTRYASEREYSYDIHIFSTKTDMNKFVELWNLQMSKNKKISKSSYSTKNKDCYFWLITSENRINKNLDLLFANSESDDLYEINN